jgi:Flp pilus assembly protein TadG
MGTGTTFRRKIETAATRHTQFRHRVCDERGSAMLEIALSCLMFLSFLFGIMEISLAVYSYHVVAESAREATRYAIVRGGTFSNACTTPGWATCQAQPADIQTYVRNLNLGLNPNNVTVTTAWASYPAGVTCTPSASCNNPGNLVTVTVQYNFPLSIPFVPPRTLAMSSTSAMVISQ